MLPLVNDLSPVVCESFVTNGALVWSVSFSFFVQVPLVTVTPVFGAKSFVTKRALERLDACVDKFMPFSVEC